VLTDGVKVPFLLDRKTTFAMLKADGLQNVRVLPFNRRIFLKEPPGIRPLVDGRVP